MDAAAPPTASIRRPNMAERIVEAIILSARWLLVVFYMGLGAALVVYGVSFGKHLVETAEQSLHLDEAGMLLAMLGMIDAALVASLIVMVMISGYENFVSRFDNGMGTELSWLGKLDAGSLKIKVASSIVAISSIHLLAVFLNVADYPNDKILWSTVLHMAFVVSAVLLAAVDRIASKH